MSAHERLWALMESLMSAHEIAHERLWAPIALMSAHEIFNFCSWSLMSDFMSAHERSWAKMEYFMSAHERYWRSWAISWAPLALKTAHERFFFNFIPFFHERRWWNRSWALMSAYERSWPLMNDFFQFYTIFHERRWWNRSWALITTTHERSWKERPYLTLSLLFLGFKTKNFLGLLPRYNI